jgi:uncharacterized RDD family membrane protein YckC
MVVKCPQCGVDVRDEAQYCENCGAFVAPVSKGENNGFNRYCWKCGVILLKGAAFCVHCGIPIKGVKVSRGDIADWGKRFLAWLIDIIILGFILAWISLPGYVLFPEFRWVPFVDLGTKNLIHFLYWLIMDAVYGQSLGKMVLNIKVTKLDGRPVDWLSAAIESVGKAFLLPIDCVIGWVLYGETRQRLFNYISETIVVDD